MNTPIASDLLDKTLAAIKRVARLYGVPREKKADRVALAGLDVESTLPLCVRCGLVHVQGRSLCEAMLLRDILSDREHDEVVSTPATSDPLHEALSAVNDWARLHVTLLANTAQVIDAAWAVVKAYGDTPEERTLLIALADLDVETPLPACSRCGLVRVQGRREEMPVCPTCEAAVLRDLLRDRERQVTALREAARALVDGLAKTLGEADLSVCEDLDGEGCEQIATRYLGWEGEGGDFCDTCAKRITEGPKDERPLRAEDLPHASALRALRALLVGAS